MNDMPIITDLDLSKTRRWHLKTFFVYLEESDGSSGATYTLTCPEAQDLEGAVRSALSITHLDDPVVISCKEIKNNS